jgi:manganese/iron transport system permease protein/iron/zinc/copper transport system permease protein
LFEPLQYEFFVRGIIAATVVGGLCGLIGVYVVLRKMSYIGHGLSHAVFGGAVVSYVMSFNFYLGASLWGFFSAVLINLMTRRRRYIGADAAIGIITTASFALGVALISRYRTFTRSFDAALFGNILGVTQDDLYAIYAVTAAAVVLMLLMYKRLLFTTFDPEVAPFYGVRTEWIDSLFSLILAGTIVVSIQVLGVTLIAAALVIPPVTARLLTENFNRLLALSVLIGALCGLTGMYLSYYVDVSSGANIVLVAAAVFMLALVYSAARNRLATLRGVASRAGAPGRSESAPAPSMEELH